MDQRESWSKERRERHAAQMRKTWATIKADPERYADRKQIASKARAGVSVGSRKGIGGWTVKNRKSRKCPEGCECGLHSSAWNIGMWHKGRPQTNLTSLDNLRVWREQQKEWVNGTDYDGQFTYTLRSQVWERDQNRCRDCRKPLAAGEMSGVVHHVDFDKGNSTIENLVLLCRSCHVGRHDRDYHGQLVKTKIT